MVEKTLDWKKNLNIDENYRVPLKEKPFSSSTIVVMVNTDFTEKNYDIFYFGYMDIMGMIGGLNASIGPLLA